LPIQSSFNIKILFKTIIEKVFNKKNIIRIIIISLLIFFVRYALFYFGFSSIFVDFFSYLLCGINVIFNFLVDGSGFNNAFMYINDKPIDGNSLNKNSSDKELKDLHTHSMNSSNDNSDGNTEESNTNDNSNTQGNNQSNTNGNTNGYTNGNTEENNTNVPQNTETQFENLDQIDYHHRRETMEEINLHTSNLEPDFVEQMATDTGLSVETILVHEQIRHRGNLDQIEQDRREIIEAHRSLGLTYTNNRD